MKDVQIRVPAAFFGGVFSVYYLFNPTLMTIPFGKDVSLTLEGGREAKDVSARVSPFHILRSLVPGPFYPSLNLPTYSQGTQGYSFHQNMKVKKCEFTQDRKTGEYKTVKVEVEDKSNKLKGSYTATLRPPVPVEGDPLKLKYEVSKVTYSGEKLGPRINGESGPAKGTLSLPLQSSPAYQETGNGGTLIAQRDLIKTRFTPQELVLLQGLKDYVANLAKKELDKTNAPHYIFVKDHFKQLAHQKKFVDRIPSDGTEDDRIDAVYHVGMQAYLTVTTGIVNAKDLGDLWELKDLPGSFINGVWMIPSGTQYNFYLASNKDFHNNRVGRNLGSQLLKKWPSQPAGTPAQRQALAEKCIDEALKLVVKAPATWIPGQKNGIVIGEGDPNVPAYVDPSKPHITVVMKFWRLTSLMSDNVLHPFFGQLRRLFGLPN